MNTPQIIRSNIMELLFQVNDVQALETIYKQTAETIKKVKKKPAFMKAVKPIRNYKPADYQTFRAIADEMVWNESLEELLTALK
jgi:hypothetical protein